MTTYYEILNVDPNADAKTIRRAYLKSSLKYHPDKNPNNVEEAKAKFIEIGQAHETLIDPHKRAAYDRQLKQQHGSYTNTSSFGTSTTTENYDTYRDQFDATVSGMSEEELAAAAGKVAAVAGMVGGILGSRFAANKARSGGGNSNSLVGGLVTSAGAMVGSAMATELATSTIKSIHRQSIERVAYKDECRRAVERGEPVPDPPANNNTDWQELLKQTLNGKGGDDTNNGGGNGSTTNGNNTSTADRMGNLWKQAAPMFQAATGGGANTNGSNSSNGQQQQNSANNNNNSSNLWEKAGPMFQAAKSHFDEQRKSNNASSSSYGR